MTPEYDAAMRVTHSVRHDMAYIAFQEIGLGEAKYQHPVRDDRLAAEIILDIAADGRLLGLEVLGATQGLSPVILKNAERIDTD